MRSEASHLEIRGKVGNMAKSKADTGVHPPNKWLGLLSPQSRLKLVIYQRRLLCQPWDGPYQSALAEGGAGVGVSEDIINEVFAAAWEAAVQRNPILLARLQTDATIVRTRQRIEELITQGCSFSDGRDRVIAELLDSGSQIYRDLH
jgi:hypothetical protein